MTSMMTSMMTTSDPEFSGGTLVTNLIDGNHLKNPDIMFGHFNENVIALGVAKRRIRSIKLPPRLPRQSLFHKTD